MTEEKNTSFYERELDHMNTQYQVYFQKNLSPRGFDTSITPAVMFDSLI